MLIPGPKGYTGMREESCVYRFTSFPEASLSLITMRLSHPGSSSHISCGLSLANNKTCHSLAGMGPGDLKESFYLCNPSQTSSQELHPVLESGRDQLAEFFSGTQALANRLLRAMEIGLNV
jgi:hypothetical protein